MKKFLCFNQKVIISVFLICLAGCASTGDGPKSESAEAVEAQPVTEAAPEKPAEASTLPAVEAGSLDPAAPTASSNCLRYGTPQNFNDQRIVAFQKLLQLQILRIKAFPMTEESTQELAKLEAIRRRTTYPLLTSSLKAKKVTEILAIESQDFVAFLDQRTKVDKQAQSLFKEMTQNFIPNIKNQDTWNCLEKKTEFEEDLKPKDP
jgi:hypothetical protein